MHRCYLRPAGTRLAIREEGMRRETDCTAQLDIVPTTFANTLQDAPYPEQT